MLATVEDTLALGESLGSGLRAGDVVVLSGPLGAGKTVLAKGIARAMDVEGPVTSPTFVLARVHRARRAGAPAMVHVDVYRLLGGKFAARAKIPAEWFERGKYDVYVIGDIPAKVFGPTLLTKLAARLTEGTRGMVGAREIGLLSPGAIFVNAARAELVDGAALRAALARRAFAGAVVDVFHPEPLLADDPLLGMEHVLLTPHIAGATKGAAERGAEVVSRKVAAFLADGSTAGSLNARDLAAAGRGVPA